MSSVINPRKLLIVRLSSLGDIVILTPVLRSLRAKFPTAQLDFLIKQEFRDLVAGNPHLNRVIGYETATGLQGFIRLARELAAQQYDLIIDMHNNLRSHLLSMICRRPLLRYHKPRLKRGLLFYLWLDLFPTDYQLLSAYYQVLAPLGIAYHPQSYPEIFLPAEAESQARQILARHGVTRPYIVLLPIATWQNKLYPLERYLAVARRIESGLGLAVVWLGGKRDDHLRRLQSQDAVPGVVIAGETNLSESLAIIKASRAVVGNDTGLTYAAEALNIPTVLILGPTARQTGAGCYRPQNVTIEKSLWCRPCSQKGDRHCYRRRRFCMERIDSDEVFNALQARVR